MSLNDEYGTILGVDDPLSGVSAPLSVLFTSVSRRPPVVVSWAVRSHLPRLEAPSFRPDAPFGVPGLLGDACASRCSTLNWFPARGLGSSSNGGLTSRAATSAASLRRAERALIAAASF